MLVLQNMKGKRGNKLKSKLVNVTCQTEAATPYLQYNQIFCDYPPRNRSINRKKIYKIIQKYFAEEQNNTRGKYSLMRYIKRRQKHSNVTKTKSDDSVIYVGTKKLKSKGAIKKKSEKSVTYLGTTYNTLDTPQNNEIIDLTQVEPPTCKVKSINASIDNPLFIQKCYPKTTKYYKKNKFYSKSDSAISYKAEEMNSAKRKLAKSQKYVYSDKKYKSADKSTANDLCLKDLISLKECQNFTTNKIIAISRDLISDSINVSPKINNIIKNGENKLMERTQELSGRILNSDLPVEIQEIIHTLNGEGEIDELIKNITPDSNESDTVIDKENINKNVEDITNLNVINLPLQMLSEKTFQNVHSKIESILTYTQEVIKSTECIEDLGQN